jgi:hypothetical protein
LLQHFLYAIHGQPQQNRVCKCENHWANIGGDAYAEVCGQTCLIQDVANQIVGKDEPADRVKDHFMCEFRADLFT